jgi:hypothetical protein
VDTSMWMQKSKIRQKFLLLRSLRTFVPKRYTETGSAGVRSGVLRRSAGGGRRPARAGHARGGRAGEICRSPPPIQVGGRLCAGTSLGQ